MNGLLDTFICLFPQEEESDSKTCPMGTSQHGTGSFGVEKKKSVVNEFMSH